MQHRNIDWLIEYCTKKIVVNYLQIEFFVYMDDASMPSVAFE